MREVTATEFAKNFGQYKTEAQREPVAITSHGRTTGYFLSAVEFEAYQKMKALLPTAYRASELPDVLAQAVSQSSMDPEHEHLNSLLED